MYGILLLNNSSERVSLRHTALCPVGLGDFKNRLSEEERENIHILIYPKALAA